MDNPQRQQHSTWRDGTPHDSLHYEHSPGGPPPAAPRRLALVVEYDGTRYAGFQVQAGQPTVQGELEMALARLTGESVRVRAASRTDSGAHARGQVVDFMTHCVHPVGSFPPALNYYLRDDVRVQAAYQVSPEFHSRKDATSRTYRYQILNRAWPSPLRRHTHFWVRDGLNVSRMSAAAQRFAGVHDFRWFAGGYPPERSTVRTVRRWDVWRDGDTVVIECEANGFLRRQIRKANALLIEIGKGRLPENVVSATLDGGAPGPVGCPQAPAHGLCLMEVKYADFPQRTGEPGQMAYLAAAGQE